jgi:hypothetical protein
MVKAKVSGVPYEVDLPEKEQSISDILFESYTKIVAAVNKMEARHMDDIQILEHEIKLVRARNERLEREAINPLQK